ncbi:MAG: phage head-tail joining protein [Aeromonas veronii]
MAFTKDDLESIDAAIASGELKVLVDGQEITYRSIAELLKARDFIKNEMAKGEGRRRSAFKGFRVVIDRGIR